MANLDPFLQALLTDRTAATELFGPGALSGHSTPADIAAAVEAARAAASRATDVGDLLTDLPGSSQPLKVDGLHGLQFLKKRLLGFAYCARVDVPGVLPPLLLVSRFRIDGLDDVVAADFGPPAPFGLAGWRAFARAPSVAALFDNDTLDTALYTARARVILRPESARRTVVEVDVHVGDARSCDRAAHLARTAARLANAAVDAGLLFAEAVVDSRPPAERVQELVARVTDAVSWVSGPVARVGDGVEARLAVEEQPDAPSVLRFDLDHRGACSVFFEGRLLDATEKVTRLQPQDGLLDRLRGAFDVKVDDAAFDDAWLIEGDAAVSKRLARHAPLLLRLRDKQAVVEVGPAGLVVRVPAFNDDDTSVVDVAGAVLSLWRGLCRDARGYSS